MIFLSLVKINDCSGFLPFSRLWFLSMLRIGKPYIVKVRRKREFFLVRKSRVAQRLGSKNMRFFFLIRMLIWGFYQISNIYKKLHTVLSLTSAYIFGISLAFTRTILGQLFLRYRLYGVPITYRFILFNFNIFWFCMFKHQAFLFALKKKSYWQKPRVLFRLHFKYLFQKK